MRFPAFWELNWVHKSVFFTQENAAFIQVPIYQPHNQLLIAGFQCHAIQNRVE